MMCTPAGAAAQDGETTNEQQHSQRCTAGMQVPRNGQSTQARATAWQNSSKGFTPSLTNTHLQHSTNGHADKHRESFATSTSGDVLSSADSGLRNACRPCIGTAAGAHLAGGADRVEDGRAGGGGVLRHEGAVAVQQRREAAGGRGGEGGAGEGQRLQGLAAVHEGVDAAAAGGAHAEAVPRLHASRTTSGSRRGEGTVQEGFERDCSGL